MSDYSNIPLGQLYKMRTDLEGKSNDLFTADDADKLVKVRAAIGRIEMAKQGFTNRSGAWSGVS